MKVKSRQAETTKTDTTEQRSYRMRKTVAAAAATLALAGCAQPGKETSAAHQPQPAATTESTNPSASHVPQATPEAPVAGGLEAMNERAEQAKVDIAQAIDAMYESGQVPDVSIEAQGHDDSSYLEMVSTLTADGSQQYDLMVQVYDPEAEMTAENVIGVHVSVFNTEYSEDVFPYSFSIYQTAGSDGLTMEALSRTGGPGDFSVYRDFSANTLDSPNMPGSGSIETQEQQEALLAQAQEIIEKAAVSQPLGEIARPF